MKKRIRFVPLSLVLLLTLLLMPSLAQNVRVSRFWHNHQPIYWPEWSGNQPNRVQFAQDSIVQKPNQYYGTTQQHPDNDLVDIFGKDDRVAAYQWRPRNSIANAPANAGYAISYSGSLIENVRSLGNANNLGYTANWADGIREAMGWTAGGESRMDMVGFTYHHSLAPLLPKEVFRKEIQTFKQVWWMAWNKEMDLSDHSKGFFPTEMAFTTELIDVLIDEGYEWAIVASHHLSRTCPTYLQQGSASGNQGISSSIPNRADMLGPSPATGWWYAEPEPGMGAWNVSPFAYQLHKVQYVNPETGNIKQMIAVPSDDVISYMIGYGSVGSGPVTSYIAPYANDPDKPALVFPSSDGDNAYGGGYDSWEVDTPNFLRACESSGYASTVIQNFVNQYGQYADLVHIEDGAWIFPVSCYGSPYFLKWVEPPLNGANLAQCVPGTIVDLETPGFSLKFWSWAPVIAGANWCETAEQVTKAQGGTVDAWKIAKPYEWWDGSYNNLNEAERAWHIYLAGLDSGFNYYGGLGNDDEVKQSLANARALAILQPWMTPERLALDATPPTIFRPQRFPWNPGGYTFGWFNSIKGADTAFRKKMGSDFYVWTHAYDVSGIPEGGVVLKIRKDKDGVNSLSTTHNETYAGGADVEAWISIPMTKRTLPKSRAALNAAANDGDIDYFIEAAEIADYYFAKVEGYRDVLLDYYIEARDTKNNVYKSDIQHVYVEDDGTPSGGSVTAAFSSNPSDCYPITVTLNAATSVLASASSVYVLYRFEDNSNAWASATMTRTSSNTFTYTFNAVPDNAPFLEVCFFDDNNNWESRNGANWSTSIIDCDAPIPINGVTLTPTIPTAGSSVTVTYDPNGRALSSAASVNIHYGYNNGNWTTAPGEAMTASGSTWTYTYTIPMDATNIVMCFNDGTTWDNNISQNWTFEVSALPPLPAGIVITNPAGNTLTIQTNTYTLQGTAGSNLTGPLLWTNPATGAAGTFPFASHWSLPVSLTPGENEITISAAILGTGGGGEVTVASDSAAAYSSWDSGDNQGTGFGAWIINGADNAGTFLAGSGNANCSVGTTAWGLWANSSDNVEIIRPFAETLAIGDTFSVQMDNNHVDHGGGVGVALQNTTGDTLWQFYFNGGVTNYSLSGGTTDITWTDAGFDVSFTLLTASTYEAVIHPIDGTARTYTGALEAATDQSIARFRAWNYTAGTGGDANFYINNLLITSPGEPSEVQYASDTVTIISGVEPFVIEGYGHTGTGLGLVFDLSSTISGATYAIYECPDLTVEPQVWNKVQDTDAIANGGELTLTVTDLTLPQNHYRIGYTTTP